MAASGAAEPRLEFTADEVYQNYPNDNSYPYTVRFWRPPGHGDRLAVRWAPPPRTDGVVMAGSGTARAQVRDVVAVAFYPVVLGRTKLPVYVMSVWRWNADHNKRMLVRHEFLHGEGYNERADQDPGELSPVNNRNENVQDCLRFSRAEVDRSLEENLWAQFGWNVARHADGYVVAWRNEPMQLMHAGPRRRSDVDKICDRNDDDKLVLEKWKCSICFNGIEENRELVSAHDATNIEGGKRRMHVFHKICLDTWIRKSIDDHNEPKCPICKGDMSLKPLLARWKSVYDVGKMTLQASMGENPFIVACTRAHRL
jgi:hypothetical protein